MTRRKISAVVWKEGSWYVAKPVNIEVASQGKTKKEALKNLQEAVDLLLEDEKVLIPPSFIPSGAELNHIYA